MIQLNGGRGRDGEHKKVTLLSATPINNDLYDLANQIRLFTQSQPDYFREAGIGDFNAYFRRARRMVKQEDTSAGVVLFNLLEEIMVRNTRPYIRAAYPNATIKGKPVAFPNRRLHTVTYNLGATYGGLYHEILADIESLFLARDEEDDIAAGSVADELDAVAEAKEYIESLPTVDLNQYELRKLMKDVEADVDLLKKLYGRTEALAAKDGKLERLKELLAGD